MNLDRTRIALANLGICFIAMLACSVLSAEAGNPKISVAVGQSITQRVPQTIKTVSIANSDVADVVVAGPRELLVNGKAVGFTTLVVWDENNVSSIFNVVVRGAFSDQQIELRVQVAEVVHGSGLEFGVDMLFNQTNSTNQWTGASLSGDAAPARGALPPDTDQPRLPLSDATALALRYVSGGTDVAAIIKAMEEQGYLKILAEPNVVAASGQSASFLSGGEYPIPVPSTGTGGAATITIEFKEYGVKVNFLPTLVDSGVINLKVAPEVSTLDFNAGLQLESYTVPALLVRRAETTVELEDGQVLVIGGLLRESEQKTVRRLPILGHIPLIGLLFSSTSTEKAQQELLLVVSPHIIRALPKGTEVALPGQESESK